MSQRSPALFVSFIVLAVVCASFALLPAAAQQQGPQTNLAALTLTTVTDWEAGVAEGALVTNNAGGEVRLADEQREGSFVSPPFVTDFAFNAVGASWQAEVPEGTRLALEVRVRDSERDDDAAAGWGAWQPLSAIDATTAASDDEGAFVTPAVLAVPATSQALQVRASFASEIERASAVLEALTLTYLSTAPPEPIFATGLPRRPLLAGGKTLTPRPAVIPRTDWRGRAEAAQPLRRTPRSLVLHQIDAEVSSATSLDMVRALASYQLDVLGWEDLSYHYLLDAEGNLFEGRLGGPTSLVSRMAAGGDAVHIGVLVPRDGTPSPTAQGVLINLMAWLGEAYGIDPMGTHRVTGDPAATDRPNITGFTTLIDAAPERTSSLDELVPQLRLLTDQSTVRARWYFAEGNVAEYSQRLALFNPTEAETEATVTLVRPGDTPVTSIVRIPANARADLTVNTLLDNALALPAIVESSAPILVERSMSLTTDIDGGPGITELSRVWYFAEGSSEGTQRTFLLLFNPNPVNVQATLIYMQRDGLTFEQDVQIAAQSRLVIAVNDITLPDGSLPLLGKNFGVQIVASQPLAAERTMRFGENGSGLHTGRGIATLARRWYFAEGTTQGDFQMHLLVLNPNLQPANVTATFMGPEGETEVRQFAVPARTQLAINANAIIPDLGVSSIVTADRPVAVERSLRFNDDAAGTIGTGATVPALRWAFVDGRTSDVTYYLCVSNPDRLPTTVTVDFSFGDGAIGSQSIVVPAGARYTMAVHEIYPDENIVSAIVRSTRPIIAERSLFPGGGVRGGSTNLGIPMP
ncbi:N-acetylmuramoyl-L-alanine amidase [Candidatus Chloroploca sp. M-50]|uniref:N-acetylmuramoyl-L-alanine amidase n=1 Tax=Candidatus Chloroploca mongolica TaxID=2528176 RepID=A0ABS4DBW2_9CHLR|nr:N-acetylmuramoyl-L-alanine amidase [Candidatus Chloroploca mongolica]MBP1466920.1 N-acetylmuramoyl-L-alanine amidase [Candidatus Chloroploca mongolica]